MNRRELLRRVAAGGGALLAGPLLQACSREASPPAQTGNSPAEGPRATSAPAPTERPVAAATAAPTAPPQPTAAPAPTALLSPTPAPQAALPAGAVPVALVKTADRAAGTRRAIELLGANPVRGLNVLLKPNFNSADPAPGSTHPDVLRALVETIGDLGGRKVTVADRSGMGETRVVMEQLGVFELSRQLGFDTVVLDELGPNDWVLRESGDFTWRQGFAVPRLLLDAPCVVQACALKTHRFGGNVTLSIKNSVGFAAKTTETGGYDYMGELHGTPGQRQKIAEINTAYAPGLIVMDGVEAFVDGGPDKGTRVRAEVVLAAADRVAIDAVGTAILRLLGTTEAVSRGRVFEQEQILRAVELGLGVDSPAKIALVTGDAASEALAAQVRPLIT